MAPKKRNAFFFFMKEIKEKEERKGRRITMTTMPNYAGPIWKKLSLVEREPYEEMARQFNGDPNLRGGKLASDGTKIEDNLRKAEEIKMLENKMVQNVKTYCNSNSTTQEQFLELAKKKLFYFMTFNVLCKVEDEEDMYIPVEVGIIEYSIQYGIHRQYTKIIYPGLPPTGFAGRAKQQSAETHQINEFGEDCSEKRLDIIFDEIKSFLSPTGNEEYPPLFCERQMLPVTVGCIDWLCKRLRKENVFQEVWDVALLLLELAAGAGKPLPSYTTASDMLTRSSHFDYHPSTRCEFHQEKDNHFCALAYSKKLCYFLSDSICKTFNVELTEKHIPTRAVEEKSYTVHVVKDPKKHSDMNPVRMDKTDSYYQNVHREEAPKQSVVPRQPASICIAAEMNRLHLNITTATVPGHGIGRGVRRN